MKVAGIRFVFLWALAFGAAATVLRLSIHAIWGVRFPEAGDVPGFLLGFAGQVAFWSILALAGLRGRMASWVALGMACAFAFFANVATFHYEAIFERLPGTRVLYYFQEVEHVQSSLQSHAPCLWVILETLVPTGILVWLAVRLRKVPSPAPARAILASSGLAAAWGLAIVTHALPSLLPQSVFWQSRIPLVYLAQSAILDAGDALGPAEVDAADLRLFLERLGRRIPRTQPNRFTRCASPGPPSRVPETAGAWCC